MPKIFEDISVMWNGERYVIPSNKVMGALARIEEHVTLGELHEMSKDSAGLKFTAIAQAYASVLRYAGANFSDEEVYAGMFEEPNKEGETPNAIVAVFGLLTMMVPKGPQLKAVQNLMNEKLKDDNQGNLNRQARRTAASLSKKRSRRQSVGG